MSDLKRSSVDASKTLKMRSGVSIRTDIGNILSGDDKMCPVRFVMLTQRDELETHMKLGIGWHPFFRDEIDP